MQEPRENLGNTQNLVDGLEEEYREGVRQIKKRNIKEDCKGELPGRYIAKMLYRWDNKRFDREYWGKMKRNWRQQKVGRIKRRRTLETIHERDKERQEEERQKIKESRIEEQNKDDEMGNLQDPYNEL